jgi:hypothetical protein
MERFSTMTLRRCYKASVNESETIIEANPFCRVRSRRETSGFRVIGIGFPAAPPIERS